MIRVIFLSFLLAQVYYQQVAQEEILSSTDNKNVVHAKPAEVKPAQVVQARIDADEAQESKPLEVEPTHEVSVNDTRSVNERYPHAVLFGGTCGGTIISPKWILTAAHCTLFTGAKRVLAGTDNSWDGSGVSRRVKRLVIHPLFTVGPYWLDARRFDIKQVAARWDFLLAELEDPLPIDGKTIAVAEINDQLEVPEGLRVGYGGFGAAHHGETMRGEMHGMELEIQADSKCKSALEQYQSEDMLCTRGAPPRYDSACNGDSGSGLVAGGRVYGVASWVQDDARRCFNGALVVFSRVAAARDWIRQVTKI